MVSTTRKKQPAKRSTASTTAVSDPNKTKQSVKPVELTAKMSTQASVNAAAVIVEYGKPMGEQDLWALTASLQDGINDLKTGNMEKAEAMLYAQAHALQAIFMNFSRRALAQEYQRNLESFLRMALKAQNQCRMTLETLAVIKNPPVVFAKQANINNGGQQQVNNGAPPAPQPAVATGGVETLGHSSAETPTFPTQRIFSPREKIQTSNAQS